MTNNQLPLPEHWRHLPRFFSVIEKFEQGRPFELEQRTFQHAIQVRRLKVGQFFILFDGQGSEYLAQIDAIERRQATASWRGLQSVSRESPTHVVLVMALIASDKMDLIIQKATELGVRAIQPVLTQHSFQLASHRWSEKQRHWEEVVISSCEQCARNSLPVIQPMRTLSEWIGKEVEGSEEATNWLLSPHAEQSLRGALHANPVKGDQRGQLLVGPEGGLSMDEETMLCERDWKRVGLGPRILRAETAAIAALSQVLL